MRTHVRVTRVEMVGYDVVFNGAHHGRDADLLCAERIPVKRPAVPVPGNRLSAGRPPLIPNRNGYTRMAGLKDR